MPYKDKSIKKAKARLYYREHKDKWIERSHRPDVINKRLMYQKTDRGKAVKSKSDRKYREKNYDSLSIKKREWYSVRMSDPVHRLARNVRGRKNRASRKRLIIEHYSRGTVRCNKCNTDDIHALTIDHVDKSIRTEFQYRSGDNLYRELINKNYPDGFQVLCANCQNIKRITASEFSGKIDIKSWVRKTRYMAIRMLSPSAVCQQCGFADIRALHIDHIDGNGMLDHKQPIYLYKKIVNNPVEYRSKLQVLCANCNLIKQHVNNEWRTGNKHGLPR